jgi:hypothetical protein
MATNILLLPIAIIAITTSTNADWLDGLEYWDDIPPDGQPISLEGIEFAMEMRTSPPVATVVLRATTANKLIRVYANTWQLIVPASTMLLVPPGGYVFDLLGFGDGYTRNLAQAQVTVLQGVTRSVIPAGIPPGARIAPSVDGMPYAA